MNLKIILISLSILVLLIGIGVAVYLIKKPQIFKSKASLEASRIEIFGASVSGDKTGSRDIRLRLIYIPRPAGSPSPAIPSIPSLPVVEQSSTPSASLPPSPEASDAAHVYSPLPVALLEPTASASSVLLETQSTSSGSIQGISVVNAVEPAANFPTHYKIANFRAGLDYAKPQIFDRNSLETGWRLSQGGGLKTVYVQFKVNGIWEDPISASTTLVDQSNSPKTEFGVQIDAKNQAVMPSDSQLNMLGTTWVRFDVPGNLSENQSASYSASVKKIAVVNKITFPSSPACFDDSASCRDAWSGFINTTYLSVLENILDNIGDKIHAIEIWDEPNVNTGTSPTFVPAQSFGLLLQASSGFIRSYKPKLEIIAGGLSDADIIYLQSAKAAHPELFSDIDAVAIHPSNVPDKIKDFSESVETLQKSLLNTPFNINKPVWITQIGIEEFSRVDSPRNQQEYLEAVFVELKSIPSSPTVFIWYGFSDSLKGKNNTDGWGLVTINNVLKPSGQVMKSQIAQSKLPPSPASIKKKEDFNNDGAINNTDRSLFLKEFQKPESARSNDYDLNNDGKVNLFDYSNLVKQFGK